MRVLVLSIAAALLAVPALAGFYDATPLQLQGPPGSVIRYQVMDTSPGAATAFRVLYRSTGLRGEPVAVSAVVIRPPGKAPASGRDVVAWAHGTTGIARPCAPSLIGFGFDVPALTLMLSRGYVVVVTDYPGLGTEPQHPYLVGDSEARGVLDAVRAARAMAFVGAGNHFIVWGHSQGGHAALFTGELARSYAPELQLMGIAAAAPATMLARLLEDDLNSPAGIVLTAMAMASWSAVFNAPMTSMVEEADRPEVDRIASRCILSIFDLLAQLESQKRLTNDFLIADPATTPPWSGFLAGNTPGKARAGAPLLIAQGMRDGVVDLEVTDDYVAALCARGTPVRYIRYPKGSHHTVVRQSANQTVAWMGERFAGVPQRTPCGQ
jgi:acetyl esterase/lipase